MFGARPLRRLIQSEIQDRLAMALLSGGVRDGDTVMVALADDGESLSVAKADVLVEEGDAGAEGDDIVDAEIIDDER